MKKKFILCGTLGWCMEILFTGLHSFFSKDYTLAGRTSIWMFPIYGMACIFSPLSQKLKTKNTLLRGSIYCFYFCRGIFIRSVFKETPDLSLGLQSCKIQYQRGHPS